MSIKVELGFVAEGSSAPFFIIDDPVKGLLDSTEYLIGGGEVLVDVTQNVRRLSINRGRSRQLDKFQAGSASVEFNNDQRLFDPTYTSGAYFGQIAPRRQLRITLDGNVAYSGIVDDWNFGYDPGGFSVASCNAFDAFSLLANLVILEPDGPYDDFPEERVGERIQRVLDFIGWGLPTDIDTGRALVAESLVPIGTNVLAYLQQLADTEPGDLFINKNGEIGFRQRNTIGATPTEVADDSSGIAFNGVDIVFGSEQLYNVVTASNELETFTAQNAESIAQYGQRDLQVTTLLANDSDLVNYATGLLAQYKEPEYRFETVTFNLLDLDPADKAALLSLEIGDLVTMKFTPSGIGNQIFRLSKCIGLGHQRNPGAETYMLKLQTYATTPWILSDALFGRLSAGNSLSY